MNKEQIMLYFRKYLSTNYLSTNNECYIGGSLASPYPTVY
jgi:hypothetical protein